MSWIHVDMFLESTQRPHRMSVEYGARPVAEQESCKWQGLQQEQLSVVLGKSIYYFWCWIACRPNEILDISLVIKTLYMIDIIIWSGLNICK